MSEKHIRHCSDWWLKTGGFTSGSGMLNNNYTGDEAKAIETYRSRSGFDALDQTTAYVFAVGSAVQHGDGDEGPTQGKMYFGKQFGFLYGLAPGQGHSISEAGRTLGHELAHGNYKLHHVFTNIYLGEAARTSDNLMSYSTDPNAIGLNKFQWDVIHDPGVIWGFAARDEDQEASYTGTVSMALKKTEFSDENRVHINTFIDMNTSLAYYGNGGSGDTITISIFPFFEPMDDNTANGFYGKMKVYTDNAEEPYFTGEPLRVRKPLMGGGGLYRPSNAWELELPDQVGFYPNFKIEFYASLTEDGEYEKMEDEYSGRLYVTFKTHNLGLVDNRLDERLLYFGCKSAQGSTSKTEVVNGIWAKFEINEANPLGNLFKEDFNPNLKEGADGTMERIGYYLPGFVYSNWAAAINAGNGNCIAFATFLQNSLQLQGILGAFEGATFYVSPKGALLIRQWDYVAQGTGANPDYPFVNVIEIGQTDEYGDTEPRFSATSGQYFWAVTPEVNRVVNGERNAAGQANLNPLAHFKSGHALVSLGEKIYDPSYGVIYNNINDFESKAIDGYFIEDEVFVNEISHNAWLIRKP